MLEALSLEEDLWGSDTGPEEGALLVNIGVPAVGVMLEKVAALEKI